MKTRGKRVGRRNNLSLTPEYKIWHAMIQRCTRPAAPRWGRYGGRGIKVCQRWLDSFDAFLADMGNRPDDQHQLDRMNNDGDYDPNNCRWVTRLTQMNNRSVTVRIEHNGEIRSKAEWARHLGLSACSLENRIRRGWTISRTLSERNKHR